MKLLLAFTPFHTPTSPPFGLSCLKASLSTAKPHISVQIMDWNLEFFRRWLTGKMPDLCDHHPAHLLGTVCPSMIVNSGIGQQILADLTQLPVTPNDQDRYMQAARLLDDIYNRLASFYHDILFPVVEGRTTLPVEAADKLFGAELAEIESQQPDLIGFSILTEQNLLYTLALSRVVHERFDIPIALGGAMMSHLDPAELLQAFPWIEFVFFGEAEAGIIDFVDSWPSRNFESVRGLAHRQNEKSCIHQCPEPLILEKLPIPDFSDFRLEDYIVPEPVLPMITSRGCYWGKCAFCSHTLPFAPGVRVRQPQNVISEMVHQMERYNVRHFLFVDEAISPNMLKNLSCEILERGLDVRFGAEGIRVEKAFDESIMQTAHDAGLRWIYVGIESSNQRLLDRIQKGIDIETIEHFIEKCQRVGITPQLSFIVGLPGTTHEELQQDIDFMKRHPVDASPFVLLLDSPMHQRPGDFDIRIEDQQLLYSTPGGLVHAPRFYHTTEKGLSPAVADAMVEQADIRRRMRPHLGEIHATLLADTEFFKTETRPAAATSGVEFALNYLTQQLDASRNNGPWLMHILGCLESLGSLKDAMSLIKKVLAANVNYGDFQGELLLHQAAILNLTDRPFEALQVLKQFNDQELSVTPALLGEQVRSHFALDQLTEVVRKSEALLTAGYEIHWLYFILGLGYEKLEKPSKALEAFKIAEYRDWLEPEINDAKARALQALGRSSEVIAERAMAKRKRRYLGASESTM